ncbi:MAG: ATP-binding cassette domain-containing protein [Aerococcaceae bacterium]|nr:ATP-binding cassette domain-containing protein [Aerococcaceae bacterium]
MEVVKLHQIKKEIVGNTLFECEQLSVGMGERIGVIGANGAGKSTLLRMIVGLDTDYKGRIDLSASQVAYIPQLKEPSTESGGEQMKRYLDEALAQRPELLILDEPTANLDADNIRWLIQQLKRYRGTILAVSHDRYFLDEIAGKIWNIEQQTITEYVGNYRAVAEWRQQEREQQLRAHKQYVDEKKRLEQQAEERLVRATKLTKRKKSVSHSEWKMRSKMGSYDGQAKALAKTGKALNKRIERLEQIDAPPKPQHIHLQTVGKLQDASHTLMRLTAGEVAIGNRTLFHYGDLVIQFGERIILQGQNQSGKTTFVRQMMNRALAGYYAPNLSIGYFSQDLSTLALDKSILENVAATSLQPIGTIRQVLGALNFRNHTIHKQVGVLSGGERVRVALAKILVGDYHLIILDEPTNYLDMVTMEALENFLSHYIGSYLLISHDAAFVQKLNATIWRIEQQQLKLPHQQVIAKHALERELEVLRLRKNQMLADDTIPLENLREIAQQIQQLEAELTKKGSKSD